MLMGCTCVPKMTHGKRQISLAYLRSFKNPHDPISLSACFLRSPSSGLCLQETFDAGLQAFQQEGIANITALKDQLLAAKHVQSKAIEARHATLMKRWNQLLSNSEARKKKLLESQEHFRKVSGTDDASQSL